MTRSRLVRTLVGLALVSPVGCRAVLCDEAIVSEVHAEAGSKMARVVLRSCGAFDSPRTHVKVGRAGWGRLVRPALIDVYAAAHREGIVLKWRGADTLVIATDGVIESELEPRHIRGTTILYRYVQLIRVDSARIAPVEYTMNHMSLAANFLLAHTVPAVGALDSLLSLPEYEAYAAHFVDAWGQLPRVTGAGSALELVSTGPDLALGTEDDLRLVIVAKAREHRPTVSHPRAPGAPE